MGSTYICLTANQGSMGFMSIRTTCNLYIKQKCLSICSIRLAMTSLMASLTIINDVTHDQSCDIRRLRHMKSSMMSRTLGDDVITSCDVCQLHHVMMSSITSCTLLDDIIMSCDVRYLRHILNFSLATPG